MRTLFKILITLVLLEIILGYTLYLRDSSRVTGNYISSTLRVLDKLMPRQELDVQGELEAQVL